MSKRSLKITTEAIISDDNRDRNLKKKIKVLNEKNTDKIIEFNDNLDL